MSPAFFVVIKKSIILPGLLVLLMLAGPGCGRQSGKPNPDLATPKIALTTLAAKSLYYNGAAREWLLSERPDLLTDPDRDPQSDRSRNFIQAVQSPPLFRKLDRQFRFDALLLVGDPSQYRPLIEHLMETRDWNVTYLDHAAVVFRRQAAPTWTPAALEPVAERFPDRTEKAIFLAQASVKMLALRMAAPAKALLDRAAKLDPKVPEVWSAQSIYSTNRGEWAQALAHADRALKLDPKFLPALASKTQIYYSTRKFDQALALSTQLVEARPEDPGLLYYHAKIAHERHAYETEITTLKKLVSLAEIGQRPSSGYRIYLGQAYAARSEAQPAIDEFKAALADPDLSPEQRKFAEELLAQIKIRSGLK